MNDAWTLAGSATSVDGTAGSNLLQTRMAFGTGETWFTSSSGRSLAFITNEERAVVMLLRGEGDPGEHAVDPDADDDFSDGFLLANGQNDEYRDTETVLLAEGVRIVRCIIDTGAWPSNAHWVSDR